MGATMIDEEVKLADLLRKEAALQCPESLKHPELIEQAIKITLARRRVVSTVLELGRMENQILGLEPAIG